MKKYKMAVGACGPRILYTNIIRAKSPEEAARIYLGGKGNKGEIKGIASRMREIEDRSVRKEDENFVDALGAEIEIGKDAAFISRQDKNAIREGTVINVTKSTITVKSGDNQYRLVSDAEDGLSIKRAIVIDWEIEKGKDDSPVDALGQRLEEGCIVAYRQDVYINNCKGFSFGTITKVTGTYAFIRDIETERETRRRHDLLVAINNA